MKTAPVKLKNIFVYPFNSKEELIKDTSECKKILIAVNAEKILKEKDAKLIEIINNNIGYADGTGAVMAVKQKGAADAVKIPGVELWLDIIKAFRETKSFFLIGSTDNVINRTVKKLKSDFPGINISGFRNGYLKSEVEREMLFGELTDKKPDIVFVAMGSPKQEYFMQELCTRHPAMYMGLGGSFDIYCGNKKRAPAIFIKTGFEWMYRLIKEPTRFKRQVVLVKFFILLVLKKI